MKMSGSIPACLAVVLAAALLLLPAFAMAEQDGSSGHLDLASQYVPLFMEGEYVGDELLSRQELSDILNRVLLDIKSGDLTVQESEADTLRQLVVEYHDEIVVLQTLVNDLQQQLDEQAKRQAVLQEDAVRAMEQALLLRDGARRAIEQLIAQAEENRAAIERGLYENRRYLDSAVRQAVDDVLTVGFMEAVQDIRDALAGKTMVELIADVRTNAEAIQDLQFSDSKMNSRFTIFRQDLMDLQTSIAEVAAGSGQPAERVSAGVAEVPVGVLERVAALMKAVLELFGF